MGQSEPRSRRDFFRDLGRYVALGSMAIGGALLMKRGGIDRSRERCVNKSVCGGCRAYDTCRLPAALSAKLGGGAPRDRRR